MASANSIHANPHSSSAAFLPEAMATQSCSNDVGPPTTTPLTNQNGWAAKQTWARHQTPIKQLYLDQKKPLVEVMRLMESQHGFKATLKMYKTHIKQWGLDKKNKEFEMRAIVRKSKQRADQGKGSIVRVRGQIRDFAEVVRYWERKGISIDDIIARQTASPTPEAVKCFTPVPTPVLTPQVLAIPERIFYCIRDYFKGSFESGTWVKTEPHFSCTSIKHKENKDDTLEDFRVQCLLACSMLSRNLFQEAGQPLIAATAKIKKILLTEDPHVLLRLFQMISWIRRQKRDEMALIILRQFSALSEVLLGSEHPLSRICDLAGSVYASNVDDIFIRCGNIMADQFESFVGPLHFSTLFMRLGSINLMVGDGTARIQMMQKLLGECEKTLSPCDIRTLLARGYLAYEYFKERSYVEAKTLSQINLAYLQHLQPTNFTLNEQNSGLYIIARCQYALGDVALGIENLHKVIASRQSVLGPQDGLAGAQLVLLEDWYLEQGDWSSAAQVRDWWQKSLQSIDMD